MTQLLGNSTNTLGQFLTIAATSIVPVVTMAHAQNHESSASLSYSYPKMINYDVLVKDKQQNLKDSDVVENFIDTIMNKSIDLAPEFSKIIEENYWDLF